MQRRLGGRHHNGEISLGHSTQNLEPGVLILPGNAVHLSEGEIPVRIQYRRFLSQKAVDILHHPIGGRLVMGEDHHGAIAVPPQGSRYMGLVDGTGSSGQHRGTAIP